MKTKITVSAVCKATFTFALLATLFSCKKNISPEDSAYDLNVILKGDPKVSPESGGFIEFRQDPDTARIIDLNTIVHHLDPNHAYRLQRATNAVTDPGCSSTAWLTLGLGPVPQDIVTDSKGDGHVDFWRAVTAIPRGTTFHIHFQIIDATTLSPVLTSDCYDYTVR